MPPEHFVDDRPDFEPRDRNGLWIYRLDRDVEVRTGVTGHRFSGRWLRIHPDGRMVIPAGYAWDGCTPKFNVFDLVILGTPDGVRTTPDLLPRTWKASLVHDALYQYYAWHAVERADIDRLFLRMLQQRGFHPARVYWLAVRLFGGWFVPEKRRAADPTDGAIAGPAMPRRSPPRAARARRDPP